MIVQEEPPPKRMGPSLRPETVEKLEWLYAHPAEWIVWCEWRGGVPRAIRGIDFERRYVRQNNGLRRVYVRYMPKERIGVTVG